MALTETQRVSQSLHTRPGRKTAPAAARGVARAVAGRGPTTIHTHRITYTPIHGHERLWAVPRTLYRSSSCVCVQRPLHACVVSRGASCACRCRRSCRGAVARSRRAASPTPRSSPGAERGHIRYSLRFRAFISFPSRPPHRSRHLGRRPRRFRDALRSASWHHIVACTSGRPPLFHNF